MPKIDMTLKHIWLLFGFILYSAGVFKFSKWYIFQALEESGWPELDFGDSCSTFPLFGGGLAIVYLASTHFNTAAMSQIALFMILYPAFFLAVFFVLKAFRVFGRTDRPKIGERGFSIGVLIFTICYVLLLFGRLHEMPFR